MQAWAQAVKQAGSLKPKAVINALKADSFDTVIGEIGFDEKGDATGINTSSGMSSGKKITHWLNEWFSESLTPSDYNRLKLINRA